MSTSIRVCSCTHEYQEQKYGNNKRVKNKCGKGWRCTVCGKEDIVVHDKK